MPRRILGVLLAACLLLPLHATATESGELLSQEDLRSLQPAYETFLDALEALLLARGLLAQEDLEQWRMVQLGDFVQNGGFGMIAAMYGPDLLELAQPQDQMLRLSVSLPQVGTLSLTTMQAYFPLDASLPGLLLNAELLDADRMPVEARFRWTCQSGGFLVWDAFSGNASDVGNVMINDGRPAYWTDQPPYGGQEGIWTIRIEILAMDNDLTVLGEAMLTLEAQGEGWVLGSDALR